MFVIADEPFFYTKMVEQLLRVARVFAGDDVDAAQRLDSPQRNILQVADRRSNNEKCSGHLSTDAILRQEPAVG